MFFPTWSAEGDVPAGEVFGTLIRDDRCLYVEANDQRTLVVWEDGMGFENGAPPPTRPVLRSRRSAKRFTAAGATAAEVTSRTSRGSRFRNDVFRRAANGDRYAIIYEVEAGPLD